MSNTYLVGGGFAVVLVSLAALFFFNGAKENIVNVPPKNTTIVAFGDSLVEGIGASPGNDFVSVLEERLNVEIINEGVAGDTTADGLSRLEAIRAYDPGIVLLLLGGNDALRRIPLETTKINLGKIIDALQDDDVLVVLIGVRGGLMRDPYDEMYEELRDQYGTAYVPNVLAGILLRSELTADQIHPNDAGYQIVADRIQEVLLPILRK